MTLNTIPETNNTTDLLHTFGQLTVILLRGVPLFPAKAIETELGYSQGKLSANVTGEARWGREFKPGRDYVYIDGEDLRAIKQAYAQTANLAVCPFAPNVNRVLAFTRRGVDLIGIKTEKPEGEILRARLVDEVFPALRERGVYFADAEPPPEVDMPAEPETDRLEAELERIQRETVRLQAETGLVRARNGSEARAARAAAWTDIAREAEALGRPDLAVRCRVKAASEVIGAKLGRIATELARAAKAQPANQQRANEQPAPPEPLWSCTEIAEGEGVTPRWLGRVIISPLGIRDDPRYARPRRHQLKSGKQVPVHDYTKEGVERIKAALAEWRDANGAQGDLPLKDRS